MIKKDLHSIKKLYIFASQLKDSTTLKEVWVSG